MLESKIKTDYKSIDCNLYDVYIMYSMHKTQVLVSDINTGQELVSGLITDLYTKDKEEFIIINKSITFRLDKVRIENKSEKK